MATVISTASVSAALVLCSEHPACPRREPASTAEYVADSRQTRDGLGSPNRGVSGNPLRNHDGRCGVVSSVVVPFGYLITHRDCAGAWLTFTSASEVTVMLHKSNAGSNTSSGVSASRVRAGVCPPPPDVGGGSGGTTPSNASLSAEFASSAVGAPGNVRVHLHDEI